MESIKKQVEDLFILRFPMYGVVYSIADIPSAVKKAGSLPKIAGVPELSEANGYLLKLYDLATQRPEEFGQFVSMIREKTDAQAQAEIDRAENARPFNQPGALADAAVFDHWAQRRWWGLDEALLLLLGRNPMRVDLSHLSDAGNASALVRKFAELRAVALTHVGGVNAQLSNPVPPGIFLKWAERYKKSIPPQLLSAVREYGHNVQDWQGAYRQKEAELEQYKAGQSDVAKKLEQANNQIKLLLELVKRQTQKADELERQLKTLPFHPERHGTSAATPRWPWGEYETKDLSLIAEAVQRFWVLYDPAQRDTAPTSKTVQDWLVTRGVPTSKAETMASIMRPSELAFGRRPGK